MAKNTGKSSSKKSSKKDEKKSFPERMKLGFKNTIKQLKAVSWPNAEKTKRNTGTVLGVIVIFALTIFIFDKAIGLLFEATGFYQADAKTVDVTNTAPVAPITKEGLEEAGITESTNATDKNSGDTSDKGSDSQNQEKDEAATAENAETTSAE